MSRHRHSRLISEKLGEISCGDSYVGRASLCIDDFAFHCFFLFRLDHLSLEFKDDPLSRNIAVICRRQYLLVEALYRLKSRHIASASYSDGIFISSANIILLTHSVIPILGNVVTDSSNHNVKLFGIVLTLISMSRHQHLRLILQKDSKLSCSHNDISGASFGIHNLTFHNVVFFHIAQHLADSVECRRSFSAASAKQSHKRKNDRHYKSSYTDTSFICSHTSLPSAQAHLCHSSFQLSSSQRHQHPVFSAQNEP